MYFSNRGRRPWKFTKGTLATFEAHKEAQRKKNCMQVLVETSKRKHGPLEFTKTPPENR